MPCIWIIETVRRFVVGTAVVCCLLVGITLGSGFEYSKGNTTISVGVSEPPHPFRVVDAFSGLSFEQPVAIVSAPGRTDELYIVEFPGTISVIREFDAPTRTVYLDISDRVEYRFDGGEAGLLGMAFHPEFEANGFVFVSYNTLTQTDAGVGLHNRLSRFSLHAEDADRLDPDSEVVLIDQFDEHRQHACSDLLFGHDGYLYMTVGDEGGSYDQFRNSQRIDKDLFSGVLRIDVDQQPQNLPPNPHPAVIGGYSIPSDNPFVGATSFNGFTVDPSKVRTEFYAVGMRTPWRFSMDPVTGTFFVNETGQEVREEINVLVKGGNYGWVAREGRYIHQTLWKPYYENMYYIPPVIDYGREIGTGIAGGVFNHGDALPELKDYYLFSDYYTGRIAAFDSDREGFLKQLVDLRNAVSEAEAEGDLETVGDLQDQIMDLVSLRPNSIQTLAFHVGISAMGIHPATGEVLLADFGADKVRKLVRSNPSGDTVFPETLSETGIFENIGEMIPHEGVIPYEINTPFWSDDAFKSRWFLLRNQDDRIAYSDNANWGFPRGATWVKHFEFEMLDEEGVVQQPLETRILVRSTGGVFGASYRWNADRTEAYLVPLEGLTEEIEVVVDGDVRSQEWRFPSRFQCNECHTKTGGYALGFNTPQLNRMVDVEGVVVDQLLALDEAGYFDGGYAPGDERPRMVAASDENTTIESRVRSFLFANCAQCHQPGGAGRGEWSADFHVSLEDTGLINGDPQTTLGIDGAKLIVPGDPSRSILVQRLANLGLSHMPPLATSVVNEEAVGLLERWIVDQLPYSVAGENMPPSVGFSDALPSTVSGLSGPVPVSLGAADSDGDVDSVEIIVNGESIVTITERPYEHSLSFGSYGLHLVEARATDDQGGVGRTETIVIEVVPRSAVMLFDVSIDGDGSVMGEVAGLNGRTGTLEISDDLAVWESSGIEVSEDGRFLIPFTLVGPDGRVFLRVLVEEQ